MNFRYSKLFNLLILILLFISYKGISQNKKASANDIMNTIITSGTDAIGTSGTVTYSIGQVFHTYIGVSSIYNVAQGIQHQELSETSDATDSTETTTEILVFPNPTADFVNVNMKGMELENKKRSYQLYDLQGRLLRQNKIDETDTQISLNQFSSSIYILQVFVDNKVLKTFKIIKK